MLTGMADPDDEKASQQVAPDKPGPDREAPQGDRDRHDGVEPSRGEPDPKPDDL
jgi:hypothetical protein